MNDSQIGKNDGLGRVFYNFRSSTNLIEHILKYFQNHTARTMVQIPKSIYFCIVVI